MYISIYIYSIQRLGIHACIHLYVYCVYSSGSLKGRTRKDVNISDQAAHRVVIVAQGAVNYRISWFSTPALRQQLRLGQT